MDFFNIYVKLFNVLNGGQVILSLGKFLWEFIFLKVGFKDKIRNFRYWGTNIFGGRGEGDFDEWRYFQIKKYFVFILVYEDIFNVIFFFFLGFE